MDLINKDEKIFIAGHKGMVGSAIYRFFKNKGYKNLLTVSREEVDLMNTSSVEHWFSREKPDITIIAAENVGNSGYFP